MIVLKILLYILLAVLGIVLLVLITPAGGEFSYIDGKLSYKVKLWVINLMDSEGGGLYGWWKKRKAAKKDKPEKPKKPRRVRKKKSKKKEREKYEWEQELDSIPVNDPENCDQPSAAETAAGTSESLPCAEASGAAAEEAQEKKRDKKKKKSKKEEDIFDDNEDTEPEEEKSSPGDKVEFLVDIWESAQRPMLKIFKGFRLKDLYIDFVIADEDAYDCALKYGRYSTLVYNGIAFFSQLFTVRLKTIDVRPQFGVSRGRWDAAGKLYFRLGTLVIAGAWFLITYFFRTFLPNWFGRRKMKKTAARQK